MMVKSSTISSLPQLIRIDSGATSKLITQSFQNDHNRLLKELGNYPELQYFYLSSILGKENNEQVTSGGHDTAETQEIYIKLMCRFAPDKVYNYLLSQDNYPLDSCLQYCKQAGIVDATTYLLERTGDVAGALSVLLQVGLMNSLLTTHRFWSGTSGSLGTCVVTVLMQVPSSLTDSPRFA